MAAPPPDSVPVDGGDANRESLEKRLAGLMKLVELTRDLAAQNDLDDVLRSVAGGACEAIGCERASVFLYDEPAGELFTRVVTQLEIEEIRTSVEEGIAGWVARRRKVANIADPTVDARWNSAFDRKTGYTTRNILAAPLVSRRDDRLVGVLQLLNKTGGVFAEFEEQLLAAFASHAATALERAELLEEARRSYELQGAIRVGHEIQKSFLPQTLPEVPGYEIAAWWEPAEDVSGDYYDVLQLPDGRLAVVIADVSGHGVGPSLIMASARAMLRAVARSCSDPAEILHQVEEALAGDLRLGAFITMFLAAVDTSTHEVEYANAGHGPALICRKGGESFAELPPSCLPLGFSSGVNLPVDPRFRLEAGDALLLATDGSIELQNADGEMFGVARLKETAGANLRGAEPIVDGIREAVTAFHPAVHPPDDVTLLTLLRR